MPPAFIYSDDYHSDIGEHVFPTGKFRRVAEALVVHQAGVDPFAGDLLGSLSLTKDGLRTRDALVIGECRRRGIPVAVTLGGGYAADIADTVEMHVNTARVLIELCGDG